MRIATKLYLGFGVLLALMLALAWLVFYDMSHVDADLVRLGRAQIPDLEQHVLIQRYLTLEGTQAHAFVLTGEVWRSAGARSARALLHAQLDQMRTSPVPDSGYPEVSRTVSEVEGRIDDALRIDRTRGMAEAVKAWDDRVAPSVESGSDELESLRQLREVQTLRSAEGVLAHTAHLRLVSLIVVLTALAAAAIASYLITKSLLTPIRAVVRGIGTLGKGDLSVRVVWPRDDEMGVVARDFNNMADQIGATIQQLDETRAALQERNEALGEAYGKLQEEVELAARVQRELLPHLPMEGDLTVAADMSPAREIGGDFFDILPGRPAANRTTLIVGDVSGKGIAAALLMVFVVSALREITRRAATPGEALAQLNRIMLTRFGFREEKFVTCFLGILHRDTLDFEFAKAGHEEPLWLRADDGRCVPLTADGLVSGLFADVQYQDRRVTLSPGDRLVLFTDGIVDARSPGGTLFGTDRLCELVEASGSQSAAELLETVRSAIDQWTDGDVPRDDMTLLILAVPESGGLP